MGMLEVAFCVFLWVGIEKSRESFFGGGVGV